MRTAVRLLTLALLVAALALAMLALSGCPSKPAANPPGPVAGPPPPPPATGGTAQITQTGSTTVLPIAQRWQEAFNKEHPEITIAVSGGGTGTGLKALINKTCNLANASRRIKDDEVQQARAAGVNPKETPIAYDAIAVIVNRSNPLSQIALEKLSEIYAGTIKDWSAVGIQDLGEIQVVARDSSSGTYESFKEMAVQLHGKAKDRDYAPTALQQASNEAVLQTVAQTKTAIGYIGLGYTNDTVKILKVIPVGGGSAVLPSEKSVRDHSYPIARQLYVYTDGEPTGDLKTYLDWCLSAAGQQIVREAGYIPLSGDDMSAPLPKKP